MNAALLQWMLIVMQHALTLFQVIVRDHDHSCILRIADMRAHQLGSLAAEAAILGMLGMTTLHMAQVKHMVWWAGQSWRWYGITVTTAGTRLAGNQYSSALQWHCTQCWDMTV
jgi:hypothetical protein